jgi:hypothetical protein
MANSAGRYIEGMERLRQSLEGKFDGDFIGFVGEESIGAPLHSENPYAFKIYAFIEALKRGYKNILWLDCSVWAIKDVQPVFDVINKEGYIMQEAGHFVGNWCNDFTLDYFGVKRDYAMAMLCYGNAGFLGLNFATIIANEFFDKWQQAMLAGCFKGNWSDHRHDLTSGSIIASKLGMKYKSGNEWLEYAQFGSKPKNETIILQAAGL